MKQTGHEAGKPGKAPALVTRAERAFVRAVNLADEARRFAVVVLVVLVFFSATQVDAAERQVLRDHVPATVSKLKSIARLESSKRLNLVIALPLRNREALTNFLKELYNPNSPDYRQFLTSEQFANWFGPTEQDYQAVADFARAHSLVVTGTHPNRTLLDVSGSVADVGKAFHIELRVYRHPTEARLFYAPDSDTSIDLTVPVLEILGLDDYVMPHPLFLKRTPHERGNKARPDVGSGPSGTYLGRDFRAAYIPAVSLLGEGQKVGLFQLDAYYPQDPVQYAIEAGLTNSVAITTLTNVLVGGFDGRPGPNNVEVALDIEMVMAMAPGAQIIVYMATNSGSGAIDVLNRMATDNLAKQLSASWSYSTGPSTVQVFQQLAGQGQTFFNSSGDSGAYAGTVTGPRDVPYITIVGGTTLSTRGPGEFRTAEIAWNSGNGAASGGGISTSWSIPYWQQGISVTENHGSTTMRNIPDVAMVADDVYAIADIGVAHFLSGTSVAAPLWAAFTALVNQKAALQGDAPVGFINPAIYAIGKGANYNTAFYDITAGNNTNSSSPNDFFAVSGYDLCTGWGSPNASLIDELLSVNIVSDIGWRLTSLPSRNWTSVASSGNGKTLVAVAADNSPIYISTSAGSTWRTTGPSAQWNAVACSADGTKMAAAAPAGAIVISSDSGATWTATPSPTYFWTSIASSGDGAKLAAGAFREGVFEVSTNSGVTWAQAAMPGGRYSPVAWSANGGVLAASPGGAAIYVSTNSGTTSTSAGLPVIDCKAVASSGDGSTLIAAGNSSVCFSRDLGKTWVVTSAPVQSWSSAASSADGYRLVAAAAGGQIYISDDGGITWTNTGPRTAQWSSVACSADGIRLVAVADNYLDGPVYTGFFPRRPAIIAQPADQPVNVGGTVTFSAAAVGTFPLSYQWLFNGTNIPGATGTALVLTNAQLTDMGFYTVMVTNLYGLTVSSNAVLSVNLPGPPTLGSQPTNQTVFAGGNAAFGVTSSGFLPLHYQWIFNETNFLGGETQASLILKNVQLSQAGNYAVVITNAYGSVTSSNAVLMVISPQPCTLLPLGLVSWWRSEGNGNDTVGGNNGTPHAGMGFAPGEVGQSFLFYGFGSFFDYSKTIRIPASASLNVGINNGFTIELWINPETFNPQSIFEWNRFDGSISAIGSHMDINVSGPGALRAVLIDDDLRNYIITSTNGVIDTDSFQHVALTYDKLIGEAILYRNGVVVATTNLGIFTPQTSFDLFMGISPFFGNGMPFQGKMDEVSIYNRTLSSNEIAAIYNGGSSGKCMLPPMITVQPISRIVALGSNVNFSVTATSAVPVTYQWRKDFVNLASGGRIIGVTNAVLMITGLIPSDGGQYSVIVSNVFGSDLSSNATLLNPPLFNSFTVMSDGTVQGVLAGWAGVTAIEASTNLYEWQVVTNIVLTDSPMQFTDRAATNFPQGFYRARVK